MKGTFRIGGAALLGVLIILGAFSMRDRLVLSGNDAVVIAVAPERKAIEVTDKDGNGVADWEDNLEAQVIKYISVSTSSSETGAAAYIPPTTFTGRFSEAFAQDYISGKIRGADFSDPTGFIGNAVKAIESNTQSERFSASDVRAVSATAEALHAYGNEIVTIMQRHATEEKMENEMVILEHAIQSNDAELLKTLKPIQEAYEGMLRDTRDIGVPESLLSAHIDLLNAYSALAFDIKTMQLAFEDPLLTLARVREYEGDARLLLSSIQSIAKALKGAGIDYGDEPGAMFFIFES